METLNQKLPAMLGFGFTRGDGRKAQIDDPEAGVVVQDAQWNALITIIVIASVLAIGYMVFKSFKASNAQSEVVSLVNGIRTANGGNPNYSALTGAAIATSGGVPNDMTASGTTAGAGAFQAAWAPAGITADFTNGGSNTGFTLAFTASDSGECTQILNAEVNGATSIKAGSTTVATNGAWATGQSAAVACSGNPALTIAVL